MKVLNMQEKRKIRLLELSRKITELKDEKVRRFNINRTGLCSLDLGRLSFVEKRACLNLEKDIAFYKLEYNKIYSQYIYIVNKDVGFYH
jgi:hypothetical protein